MKIHLTTFLLLAFATSYSQQSKPSEQLTSDTPVRSDSLTVLPKYPGGEAKMMEFLIKTIQYPEQSAEKGISGVVYVSFLVKASGAIDEVTVVRSIAPDLDAEAVRVVKAMPAWIPGEYRGTPVDTKFILPVRFELK